VAISFVNFSATSGGAAEPASVQSGDLLIAMALSGSASTPGAPAGWASLGGALQITGTNVGNLWYIGRGGSAPSYAFTNVTGGGVNIWAFRGASTLMFDAVVTGTSTSSTVPSATVTQTSDWLLALYADNGSTSITAPSGMTEPGSPNSYSALAYNSAPALGASGTKLFGGTSTPIGAWMIAIFAATPALTSKTTRPALPRAGTVLRPRPQVAQAPNAQQVPPALTVSRTSQRRADPQVRRSVPAQRVQGQIQPPTVPALNQFRPHLPGWPRRARITPQPVPPQRNPIDILQAVTTRARMVFRPRTTQVTPVPPQFNPIIAVQPVGTRARMIFRPRTKQAFPTQPQANPVLGRQPVVRPFVRINLIRRAKVSPPTQAQQNPVFIIPAVLRPWRRVNLTRPGKVQPQPVPPQANPVFIIPAVLRPFRRVNLTRPGKVAMPIPPQTNPVWIRQAVLRPFRRVNLVRRPSISPPTAPQFNPIINIQPIVRAFRRINLTRRPLIQPQRVQAQQNNPIVIQNVQRPWRRIGLPGRAKIQWTMPPQTLPVNPGAGPTARRRFGYLRRRPFFSGAPIDPLPVTPQPVTRRRTVHRPRTRLTGPVPAQVAPPIQVQPVQPRRRLGLFRRGSAPTPVPAQANPVIDVQPVTPRRRLGLPRRGVTPTPVPLQRPITPAGFVPRRRLLPVTGRRRQPTPVTPDAVPVTRVHPNPRMPYVRRATVASPPLPQSPSVGTTRLTRTRRFGHLARRGLSKIPVFGGLAPVLDVQIIRVTEIKPGWQVTPLDGG
jgi:hypothetical protein